MRPALRTSVVFACGHVRSSIRECLTAVVYHAPDDEVDILVVDSSHDENGEIVKDDLPDMLRVIVALPSPLIPGP